MKGIRITRRRFLGLAATTGFLAGCAAQKQLSQATQNPYSPTSAPTQQSLFSPTSTSTQKSSMEVKNMRILRIADQHDHFEDQGKNFFYLADTVWTAFYDANFEEWEEYLDYRKMQGFTVLQISLLSIWGEYRTDMSIYAFKRAPDGGPDFYQYNEEYFAKAAKMLGMAVDRGFTPALVVLWGNYVKDTWQTSQNPELVMPFDAVEPYVSFVVDKFSQYHPVYIISGDTNFGSTETKHYYLAAMKTIKSKSMSSLTTLHIWGDSTDLPNEIMESKDLDFYAYQSGHRKDHQEYAYVFAQSLYHAPIKRPVINSELCYESGGYYPEYGRFSRFDVRKAIWQSLLSGAKAGVTYGSQGLWSWQQRGGPFLASDAFGPAFYWRNALRLEGAWDAGFARWVFENYDLFDIEPQDIVLNETTEIRASASSGFKKILIYIPYSIDVSVKLDLSKHHWSLINLTDRHFGTPTIIAGKDISIIKMHEYNSDQLLIGIDGG